MISQTIINVFISMIIVGICAPTVLAIIWNVKNRQKISITLIGAAVWFVFAIVLETFPKLILFQNNNPIGKAVMSNAVLVSVIGGLLAGIFEETGRFLAFGLLIKNRNRKTSITYGIGHGGFEALYLLVIGGVQNLSYAIMINNGQFDELLRKTLAVSFEQYAQLASIPAMMKETSFLTLGISSMERVSAIIIHISCSILVYVAVKSKGKKWLYPLAILLHASVDLFAGLFQVGLISNLYLFEVLLLVWAIAMFITVLKTVYYKYKE